MRMIVRVLAALAVLCAPAAALAPQALAQAIKISQLPGATSGSPTDLIPCVQGGVTARCTSAQVALGAGAAMLTGAAFTGATEVTGAGPVVKLGGLSGGLAPDGIFMASSDMFASCPYQAGTGCGSGADTITSNEHKMLLVRGATEWGAIPEWPVTIDEQINTGRAPAWAAGATHAVGDLVTTSGGIYTATVAGTSASGGSGPTGTGASIADGSVYWAFSCTGGCNDKLSFNATSTVGPNAGPAWDADLNLVMLSGADTTFDNTLESDFSNSTGTDCTNLVTQHCANVWLFGGGSNEGTSALIVSANNIPTKAYVYPIWLPYAFGNLCGAACVEIDPPGPVALDIAGDNFGSAHSIASIRDSSASRDGIQMNGTYSNAIWDSSLATATIAIELRSEQQMCLSFQVFCEYYDSAGDNKRHTTNTSGVTIEKLDNVGNEYIGGSLTMPGSITALAAAYSSSVTAASLALSTTGGITMPANTNVCFTGTLFCGVYNSTTNKFYFTSTFGTNIMSLDNAGHLTVPYAVTVGTP